MRSVSFQLESVQGDRLNLLFLQVLETLLKNADQISFGVLAILLLSVLSVVVLRSFGFFTRSIDTQTHERSAERIADNVVINRLFEVLDQFKTIADSISSVRESIVTDTQLTQQILLSLTSTSHSIVGINSGVESIGAQSDRIYAILSQYRFALLITNSENKIIWINSEVQPLLFTRQQSIVGRDFIDCLTLYSVLGDELTGKNHPIDRVMINHLEVKDEVVRINDRMFSFNAIPTIIEGKTTSILWKFRPADPLPFVLSGATPTVSFIPPKGIQ